jgi:hypothetical protein
MSFGGSNIHRRVVADSYHFVEKQDPESDVDPQPWSKEYSKEIVPGDFLLLPFYNFNKSFYHLDREETDT